MTTSTLDQGLYEVRDVDFDLKPSRNGRNLRGYVAVFNTRTRISDRNGAFDEVLVPGFADRSLRENGLPVMQFDHGRDPRVGTVPVGVWTSWDRDGKGYQVRGHLIDDPVIEPVRKAIAEGAVTGLSFRFKVPQNGDKWERRFGDADLRHVHDADVHEAGPVVFPAYRDAKVSIRDRNGLAVVERHFDDDDMDEDFPTLRSAAEYLDNDDEDDEARTVVAYAHSWRGITEQRGLDGQLARVRIGRHSLDEWLALWRADGRPPLPILREHGQDGHSRAVGHLVDAEADDYGLLTTAVYHDTDEGRAALGDIVSGVLKGYSQHLQVVESRDVDGVVEVTSAVPVEVGPTMRPFDFGAVIIEAGGVPVETRADFESMDDVIDFIRIHTGKDTATVMAEERAREQEFARKTAESVYIADALAAAIGECRSTASEAYFEWTRRRHSHDFEVALRADRDESDLFVELLDQLHHDRALVSRVLASNGVPAYKSPFRSARNVIDLGR